MKTDATTPSVCQTAAASYFKKSFAGLMIHISKQLLPLLLWLTPGAAWGELTLTQCFELAGQNNPNLRSLELERELNRPAALAAWGQFLPSVAVGFSLDQSRFYSPTYINPDGTVATYPRRETVTRTSVDPVTGYIRVDSTSTVLIDIPEGRRRGSDYFLRVDEIIFDGGRNYLDLKNAALTRRSREHRLNLEKLSLRLGVTQAYAAVMGAERRLELASSVAGQRRRQLGLASARFETGSVTQRDVMQAEVDLGRALTDSLDAAQQIRRGLEQINLLVGLPVDTLYSLASLPPPFRPGWNADSLAAISLLERPDLSGALEDARLKGNRLLQARGEYLPNLTASIFHRRSEQSGVNVDFRFDPRNSYTEYALSASWQLFDRFTRGLINQEAEVQARQSAIALTDLTSAIKRDVHAALDRLAVLYEQIQVANHNRDWAARTLEFEQERYRLGSATVIELGAAQVSFIQASHDLIRLETDFIIALAELEFAVGRPLSTFSP